MTRFRLGAVLLSTVALTACDQIDRVPARPASPPPEPAASPAATPLPPASATPEPEKPTTQTITPQPPLGAPITLAENGEARCVIVTPADAQESVNAAVAQFVGIVERSLGVTIPVIRSEEETANLPASVIPIFVGDTKAAAGIGLTTTALPPDTYRLVAGPDRIIIVGAEDGPPAASNRFVVARPTLWALNHLLEESLGVRWLWPGQLGTYVPKHSAFVIRETDRTYRPLLEYRSLRLNIPRENPFALKNRVLDRQIKEEVIRWSENHQSGRRTVVTFGHSFEHWWDRYSAEHPDYFAELPAPYKQPFPKASHAKLRIANPAVVEQIAKEYEAAGAPLYWNVSPNDGNGFDISKESAAWDSPPNQAPGEIFAARGKLTARYVRFWNNIYERLKQINPDVILVTYAYSSYRKPPEPTRPLTAKAILQIVDGMEAYKEWKEWAKYAHGLYLRPNWWHQGADAPYLTVRPATDFIRFAHKERMIGLDMDSILGYWATQGLNYYAIARVMNDPEITTEIILDEYTSAFGKGKPKIAQYLDYWRRRSEENRYSLNAAPGAPPPRSKYHDLAKSGKIPASILNGSKYALPFLYNEQTLGPAERLLNEAAALIGDSDPEALQRVEFLRNGLNSLRATREQIVLGQKLKTNPTKKNHQAFEEGYQQLEKTRESFARDHVIWPEAVHTYENRYKVLIRPSAFGHHHINLDGF